jgi:hypothetical protein
VPAADFGGLMSRFLPIAAVLLSSPALALTEAEKVCVFRSAAQLPKIEGMQMKKAWTSKPEAEAVAADPKTIAINFDLSIGGVEMTAVYWCSDRTVIMRGIK